NSRLARVDQALGADADWPRDLIAVAVTDFDGDNLPDLLVWSESSGLYLHRNQGNGNYALKLDPTGHRKVEPTGTTDRCNADGVGVWVIAQVEDQWTGAEYPTLAAGLGQSRQPLTLGLGRHPQVDVVRLRWPDRVWQAEFNLPTNQLARIDEKNRKR